MLKEPFPPAYKNGWEDRRPRGLRSSLLIPPQAAQIKGGVFIDIFYGAGYNFIRIMGNGSVFVEYILR